MYQVNQLQSTSLKGIAILMVLFIHLYIPSQWYQNSNPGWLFTALNQFSRLSVPLFVFLSGWGLAQKYKDRIVLSEFISRRLLKLLPLYFLWSFIAWGLFQWIPSWQSYTSYSNIFTMLLTGKADYQLYFVPMIFQLYLLFILIHAQRHRIGTILIISAILQSIIYFIYYQNLFPPISGSDQTQYFWFFTWIYYFVLGIQLAYQPTPKLKPNFIAVIAVIGLILSILESRYLITSGLGLIAAHRFTKYSVFMFVTAGILTLTQKKILNRLPLNNKILVSIGAWSYIIYLSHTLFFRLFADSLSLSLPIFQLLSIWVILITGVYISKKL